MQRYPKQPPPVVGTPVGLCLGVLLCGLVTAKAICGGVLLGLSTTVGQRAGFSETLLHSRMRNSTLTPRMCVCESALARMDPLGRMGMRGALTSERFCRRCWTAEQVALFRMKLTRGSSLIPWAVWLLASPLLTLVLLPFFGNWPKLQAKTPTITMYALGADIVMCLVMGAFSLDWGAFKSLCVHGHAFDERYKVEVPFIDALYFDVCAYSSAEERMAVSIGLVIVLDLVVVAIIFYMRSARLLQKPESRRSRTFLGRLAALTESAKPVWAFDTLARQAAQVPGGEVAHPRVVGSRQGDWGIGLSLMPFAKAQQRDTDSDLEKKLAKPAPYRLGSAGGARPMPDEEAPRRAGKKRPTHPWVNEKWKRMPPPQGDTTRATSQSSSSAAPKNDLFKYALSISHTKGETAEDSDDSMDGAQEHPHPELFHPAVARARPPRPRPKGRAKMKSVPGQRPRR